MSAPTTTSLDAFHRKLGANFATLNGAKVVADYGDTATEQRCLWETVGVLDLSFRGRLCLTGTDRVRFLHGQITNDVKKLAVGQGCYSAITNAKGKIQSDLNIFCLPDELVLDFEPGLADTITARLEKYIVSDDVQIVDAAPHYGLLSVQGPQAAEVIRRLDLFPTTPADALSSTKLSHGSLGEIYLMNHPRLGAGAQGFDIFAPVETLETVAGLVMDSAKHCGGRLCGWNAFEIARIEAGIPRSVADMDETNIASECGIESRAISYNKGCYIGQEVLNRIHSIGHVNRTLRGLRFETGYKTPPERGAKIFCGDKEAGHITSSVYSTRSNRVVALGYVRREALVSGEKIFLLANGISIGVTVCDETVHGS